MLGGALRAGKVDLGALVRVPGALSVHQRSLSCPCRQEPGGTPPTQPGPQLRPQNGRGRPRDPEPGVEGRRQTQSQEPVRAGANKRAASRVRAQSAALSAATLSAVLCWGCPPAARAPRCTRGRGKARARERELAHFVANL
ncbi:hypothetical protein NDU88_005904 [Pleurodeles waltl]|uniref:Uncharacterized protein n=1 Tax=Pleurodeles waltl TaxID=8319 RepID=A0AAV7WZL2_PLEWA|nr:hypothetical protein NDU88_005904 [Pleurodeles waltl]